MLALIISVRDPNRTSIGSPHVSHPRRAGVGAGAGAVFTVEHANQVGRPKHSQLRTGAENLRSAARLVPLMMKAPFNESRRKAALAWGLSASHAPMGEQAHD